MKATELSVRMWVYFCYNFPQPSLFIHYIVDHADGNYDYIHLVKKWEQYYKEYGSGEVMQRFYINLSSELQDKLAEYAIHVWAPVGMSLTDEKMEILGINK